MRMKLESEHFGAVKVLIPEIYKDQRGFFLEEYRADQFAELGIKMRFVQENHSGSIKGVVRGLHFQWNPYMGKLVRTIRGRMVDLAIDIRKSSPTIGKIIAYDMPDEIGSESSEWIWVPPGFAHGNFFTDDTIVSSGNPTINTKYKITHIKISVARANTIKIILTSVTSTLRYCPTPPHTPAIIFPSFFLNNLFFFVLDCFCLTSLFERKTWTI